MSDGLKVLCGALAFLALACFGIWSWFQALRTGVFTSRGVVINRLDNPIQFWGMVSIGLACFSALGVFCIAVIWLVLTHWGV